MTDNCLPVNISCDDHDLDEPVPDTMETCSDGGTENTGVENAGVDNTARDDKGGQGGSGQCGSGNTGQTIPTTSAEAVTAVRNSRYAVLDDSEFYRGLADAGGDGSALVFASNAQLELLQSATQIYFDATFKVVPTIYYQLFTVFVPFADSAFPLRCHVAQNQRTVY